MKSAATRVEAHAGSGLEIRRQSPDARGERGAVEQRQLVVECRPVPQSDAVRVRRHHGLLRVIGGRHHDDSRDPVASLGHHGSLDGVAGDHPAPTLQLDDRAPLKVGEEEVRTHIPANTEPSHSVAPASKEVLEQGSELAACHGVDSRHAAASVRLTLFHAARAQPRHRCQDEHHDSKRERTPADVVRTQRGAEGEAPRSGNRGGGRGEVTREGSDRGNPPDVPFRDPPGISVRRACRSRARRGGTRATALSSASSRLSGRPRHHTAAALPVVHGFECSVIARSSHRIRQHLVRFLDQSKEGNRTAEVRMDPLDQRTVFCLDLVGGGHGRNPENVVVRISSHLLIMPPVLCSALLQLGLQTSARGHRRVRIRRSGRHDRSARCAGDRG